MNALVTGGTGFIGQALIRHLERPAVLTRDVARAARTLGNARPVAWDGKTFPGEALGGIDVVFNLAGESVAGGRWTQARKDRIRSSRIEGTRSLVAALRSAKSRPKVLVSASAVGYYGSRGDEILRESASPGADFLAECCRDWEKEAMAAAELGIRVATIRTGIVLGPGGMLAQVLTPFRLGLGGPLGNGKQWMPWIHVDDEVGLLLHAARSAEVSGPLNASAPTPVTNQEFTKALGRALHRPAFLPLPTAALRVIFGELAGVLVASQRVIPAKASQTGFVFRYSEIDEALRAVVAPGAPDGAGAT